MGHTPGPWEVVMPGEVDEHYAVMDGFGHTASVYGYPANAAEARANAQLMAAAPELLRAMRLIADDLGALDLDSNGWRTWDATAVDSLIAGALRLATLAIAKAEGRSE